MTTTKTEFMVQYLDGDWKDISDIWETEPMARHIWKVKRMRWPDMKYQLVERTTTTTITEMVIE